MLLSPEGPSRTPQMIYPNMGGRPARVQIQPQGRDNITTETKSCTYMFKKKPSILTKNDSKQINTEYLLLIHARND